jgi:hypothetical protein
MTPAPAGRPGLRLVPPPVPAPATKKWKKPRYRPLDPQRLAVFRPLVRGLLDYASARGLRVAWITLTSWTRGAKPVVAADIKAMWERFRHKTVAREMPVFLAVFSTHGRPHAHVLAVLPSGTSARAVCGSWCGGFTDYSYVDDLDDADDLSAYCASQFSPSAFNPAIRRRSFSFRPPPDAHLVCCSTAIVPSYPAAPPRAEAGGHAPFGEARGEGVSAAPSWRPQADSGRPQAGGAATRPEPAAEANCVCPPRCSEHALRLAFPPPTVRITLPTYRPRWSRRRRPEPRVPSPRLGLYTSDEVELAMLRLCSFLPRDRGGALPPRSIAHVADMDDGLVDESLMRLLYAGQLRRRRVGREYVYWAARTLPPAPPSAVEIPGHLRWFRCALPSASTTAPNLGPTTAEAS